VTGGVGVLLVWWAFGGGVVTREEMEVGGESLRGLAAAARAADDGQGIIRHSGVTAPRRLLLAVVFWLIFVIL